MLMKQHYSIVQHLEFDICKGKVDWVKEAMDCMALLGCVNLSYDNKRPLLITAKSKKTCFFKGVNVDKLPVVCGANANAWVIGFCSKNGCASGINNQRKKLFFF